MASMEMTNAKKDLWLVRDKNGKVVVRDVTLRHADTLLRKTQENENYQRRFEEMANDR